MSAELIFEIGTEEIPAGMIPGLRENLTRLAREKFSEARIDFDDFASYSTPRRLVLQGRGLAESQTDKEESVRGPAEEIAFNEEGKPTRAGEGFARGQNISLEEVVIRDGYLFAEKTIAGRKTGEVLQNLLPDLVNSLPQPQKMRWGDKEYRFVRPIRWLLALLDDKVIDFELAGMESGRATRGHRFLGHDRLEIPSTDRYFELLISEKVLVKNEERRSKILEQLEELLPPEVEAVLPEELLQEVVNLVEYPTAFLGEFSQDFLSLPDEVLTTSMIKHQRYFPLEKSGSLINKFVGVRNGDDKHLEEVIKGNEMVIRARLADAVFFYREDQKKSPEEFNSRLDSIIYQEELGSLAEKVERLKNITREISSAVSQDEEVKEQAARAAELAKFDLVTEMVREFASLQGFMGGEYARLAGESSAVARAIAEQYLPSGSEDELPESQAGLILSLSDKADDIMSNFYVGNIPTGSQDPFALRRKATAIIRVIIEKDLDLDLEALFELLQQEIGAGDEVRDKVLNFLEQRLRNYLAEEGIRYDVINAVLEKNSFDLDDIYARCRAVMQLREKDHEDFLALMYGLQRCQNLALQGKPAEEFSPELLQDEEEKNLWEKYQEAASQVQRYYESEEYFPALLAIADLKTPVDEFLDNVVVMVEDEELRRNRLKLLELVAELIKPVMDIAEIALDED